ncbi:LysE family transporter [Pseudomonas sp. HN11]|uniref:LysE family translocator n=1 Tax=Pseudomonas sp. HN11 TaxID=1344094 RepID=UPI001F47A05A|nr:LysE family transporter [Pseudomonas sp. HN11]UII72240.1 LysE family transporter [Pseudomonas sp. HN11]
MDIFNPIYVAHLVSLALLWTVAVVTPGPNFFNTAQLAASCSRRHGVVASAGVATGTIMWGLAGGLGIKSLFTAAPMLYQAFKIIGGCRSRKWLDRFAGGCYVLFGAHLVANR